ncbi:RutC family protein YjgH [bacterium YEK0313]|nr:RutC family protein YjgH [bacterium YEK0313]
MLDKRTPAAMPTPFAKYSHSVIVPAGTRMLFCSGQLGLGTDGVVPDDVGDQADLCFKAIGLMLADAGMDFADIVRVNAFVTDRAFMAGYMASRDRHMPSPPPASTLMIVSGFTRPEFKVEIEVIAAKRD